jgi:hypothetical protein
LLGCHHASLADAAYAAYQHCGGERQRACEAGHQLKARTKDEGGHARPRVVQLGSKLDHENG